MHRRVMILLLCLLSVTIVHGQEVSPELQEQLDAIELATSDIRELDRLEDTILDFPTTEELEDFLRTEFDEEYDDSEFTDDLLFYVALDLMEPHIDLEAILIDFLLSQVAGFYDPETDTMNVILIGGGVPEDSLPILERITYSHEYVHALQDQHFDLEALLDEVDASENSDYQLAVLSLVEGDATQAMTDYTTVLAEEDPLALAEAVFAAGADLGGVAVPETIPAIIEEELLFPYFNGQLFVSQIVSSEGWSAINDAFTINLPQSTEHIYHPDRYLAGDMPIEVTIPDMRDLLDDRWRLAQDTPVGEFYLRQHLDLYLPASQVADMTTGWGGDRINIWVDDATGELAWVMYQVWDTAEDATEFVDGYGDYLLERFPEYIGTDRTCWTFDETLCFTQIDEVTTRISSSLDPNLAFDLVMMD